jgi:hypothetical protein
MKAVALDAGGATLKASVVAPGVTLVASVLGNHVAATAANPSTAFMGQKLLELERQRAKMRYVRPVQRLHLARGLGPFSCFGLHSELCFGLAGATASTGTSRRSSGRTCCRRHVEVGLPS